MGPERSPRRTSKRSVAKGGSGVDLDTHQELITRLYHTEEKSLEEVMRIISEEWNINVSERVFKGKISQWNIQRNLSRNDVAAALHLARRAERNERTCKVYIRDKHVSWERIHEYLRKKKISAESLVESDPCDVIPPYITVEVVDSAATTPLLSIPPIEPGLDLVTSYNYPPHSALNGSHATTMAPSSGSLAKTTPRHDLANGSYNAAFGEAASVTLSAETYQKHLPLPWQHDQVGQVARRELAESTSESLTTIVQQSVGDLIDTTDPPVESPEMLNFYGFMSVTPSSVGRVPGQSQSISPLSYTKSSLYPQDHLLDDTMEAEQHKHYSSNDGSYSHSQVGSDTLQPLDWPAYFLSRSIWALLRKKDGLYHEAELAMKDASKSFERMVANRHGSCLTSLNYLLGLLEAHGKRDVAMELLGKFSVAASSMKSSPETESVKRTIRFKMDIFSGLKVEEMFPPATFRDIHSCFERSWGPNSPSTLACLCNLGWRLAGDKGAKRHEEALEVLSQARVSLEQNLGHDNPQTIMCLNVLARVLYNLGNYPEALEVMDISMSRITTQFPAEYHPFRVAARRRHALFMEKVRSGNAEPILRDVASKRFRVLGPDCALTQGSMKELRDFLRDQGRHDDANNALEAIKESASSISCGESVVPLF
ncbi:hypothetical protein EPUS_05570 [Endocarpon pusillum Z07020]|uniref:Clr5 domain-containing protein n=1 Tax=Endocarpon pusillum (strain Z07020 / HMAS-L-300199) TaxID=1263415 RepID=U1GHW9_ENDPU|nr:uncharacterized protein EPUS_05570 [Endocarpon pusillum Z07020]ERF71698.1 hypothetical protein EPUS_05570 [Endocarpon pusillum Z07020]